jgi:hypothetical protein
VIFRVVEIGRDFIAYLQSGGALHALGTEDRPDCECCHSGHYGEDTPAHAALARQPNPVGEVAGPVVVAAGQHKGVRALPEKNDSGGIPLRARIGFKNRTGRQASMRWGSRIQRICVSG